MLRSKIRAAGVLLGLVAAGTPAVLTSVVNFIAPMPTLYGIHYRRLIGPEIKVVASPVGGFWLGIAALLMLCLAAISRLTLGPRKAAYPQNELERIAT